MSKSPVPMRAVFGTEEHMAMQFTDENFEAEVMKSDKPVLVDFWAPWCGPCQMMGPVIDALATEVTTVKIGKLNVDENPDTASEFGIMSIPTIKVFKGGQVVKEWMGVQSKDKLKEELSTL
jgi:thioredoxin 1